MTYALPMMQTERVNDDKTPHLMQWLRRVYSRPAIAKNFDYGRTQLAERAHELIKTLGAGS